jgi:hypothetical protein
MQGQLVAWLTPGQDEIEAMYVAEGTTREPARRMFRNSCEARRWVDCEAAAVGAAVKWVT